MRDREKPMFLLSPATVGKEQQKQPSLQKQVATGRFARKKDVIPLGYFPIFLYLCMVKVLMTGISLSAIQQQPFNIF